VDIKPDITLADFFLSNSEYDRIIDLLIEKKWVVETDKPRLGMHNFFHKTVMYKPMFDRTVKDSYMLADLLMHLEQRGYFHRAPTVDERKLIAQNTFNIKGTGAAFDTFPLQRMMKKKVLPDYLETLGINYFKK